MVSLMYVALLLLLVGAGAMLSAKRATLRVFLLALVAFDAYATFLLVRSGVQLS